jgi:hypothetical protein
MDTGPGSLRQAILDTPAGGTVDFDPALTGTITLTTGELAIDHSLTIDGPGADVITVSGNHASRVFNIIASAASVAISGLAIADGRPQANGGGIYNSGALSVTDCTLMGNTVDQVNGGAGGGIYNVGTLTVANAILSGNSAQGTGGLVPTIGVGGGIYNSGTLTVTGSTLSGNSAQGSGFTSPAMGSGGGLYNLGTLTVTHSTLSGNSASGNIESSGGGIYNSGTLTVSESIFSSNSASRPQGSFGYGGGIYNVGTLLVTGSTLSNNTAAGGAQGLGGGICNNFSGTATVTESTLTGNFASASPIRAAAGAGIYNVAALTVTDVSLSRNSSSGVGGGIYTGPGSGARSALRNTLVAQNTAVRGGPDVSGSLTSQGHNLIGDGTGGSGYDATDLVGTPENPIDPLLGPLQDNGGPTFAMALLPGSPALNAGDPTQLGIADQRGVVRSGGVNIGAYQASASAFLLSAPDTVPSGVPFDVTVSAVDIFGQVAVGYTGTVTFSTSDTDPGVVLPADYTFTAADGGVHTFTDTGLREITLVTPGDQTLTVTDTTDDTINRNATITVMGGNAAWTHDRFWTDLAPSLLSADRRR